MAGFPKRRIGRTGVEVSELGLGCATLGGSRIDVARRTAEEIASPPVRLLVFRMPESAEDPQRKT
ncbi:MAG TPA: hypothetical protein VHG31_08685 [Stellaceae bacterium]|nr:hypothetical protein [Stellaceae bacterium]